MDPQCGHKNYRRAYLWNPGRLAIPGQVHLQPELQHFCPLCWFTSVLIVILQSDPKPRCKSLVRFQRSNVRHYLLKAVPLIILRNGPFRLIEIKQRFDLFFAPLALDFLGDKYSKHLALCIHEFHIRMQFAQKKSRMASSMTSCVMDRSPFDAYPTLPSKLTPNNF